MILELWENELVILGKTGLHGHVTRGFLEIRGDHFRASGSEDKKIQIDAYLMFYNTAGFVELENGRFGYICLVCHQAKMDRIRTKDLVIYANCNSQGTLGEQHAEYPVENYDVILTNSEIVDASLFEVYSVNVYINSCSIQSDMIVCEKGVFPSSASLLLRADDGEKREKLEKRITTDLNYKQEQQQLFDPIVVDPAKAQAVLDRLTFLHVYVDTRLLMMNSMLSEMSNSSLVVQSKAHLTVLRPLTPAAPAILINLKLINGYIGVTTLSPAAALAAPLVVMGLVVIDAVLVYHLIDALPIIQEYARIELKRAREAIKDRQILFDAGVEYRPDEGCDFVMKITGDASIEVDWQNRVIRPHFQLDQDIEFSEEAPFFEIKWLKALAGLIISGKPGNIAERITVRALSLGLPLFGDVELSHLELPHGLDFTTNGSVTLTRNSISKSVLIGAGDGFMSHGNQYNINFGAGDRSEISVKGNCCFDNDLFYRDVQVTQWGSDRVSEYAGQCALPVKANVYFNSCWLPSGRQVKVVTQNDGNSAGPVITSFFDQGWSGSFEVFGYGWDTVMPPGFVGNPYDPPLVKDAPQFYGFLFEGATVDEDKIKTAYREIREGCGDEGKSACFQVVGHQGRAYGSFVLADGMDPEFLYLYRRDIRDTDWGSPLPGSMIDASEKPVYYFTDKTVQAGKSYDYRVHASFADHNTSSEKYNVFIPPMNKGPRLSDPRQFKLCSDSNSGSVEVYYVFPSDVGYEQLVHEWSCSVQPVLQEWYACATGGLSFRTAFVDGARLLSLISDRSELIGGNDDQTLANIYMDLATYSEFRFPSGDRVVALVISGGMLSNSYGWEDPNQSQVIVSMKESDLDAYFDEWRLQEIFAHELGHAFGIRDHSDNLPRLAPYAGHSVMRTGNKYTEPPWPGDHKTAFGFLSDELITLYRDSRFLYITESEKVGQSNNLTPVNQPDNGVLPGSRFSLEWRDAQKTIASISFEDAVDPACIYYWVYGDGKAEIFQPVEDFTYIFPKSAKQKTIILRVTDPRTGMMARSLPVEEETIIRLDLGCGEYGDESHYVKLDLFLQDPLQGAFQERYFTTFTDLVAYYDPPVQDRVSDWGVRYRVASNVNWNDLESAVADGRLDPPYDLVTVNYPPAWAKELPDPFQVASVLKADGIFRMNVLSDEEDAVDADYVSKVKAAFMTSEYTYVQNRTSSMIKDVAPIWSVDDWRLEVQKRPGDVYLKRLDLGSGAAGFKGPNQYHYNMGEDLDCQMPNSKGKTVFQERHRTTYSDFSWSFTPARLEIWDSPIYVPHVIVARVDWRDLGPAVADGRLDPPYDLVTVNHPDYKNAGQIPDPYEVVSVLRPGGEFRINFYDFDYQALPASYLESLKKAFGSDYVKSVAKKNRADNYAPIRDKDDVMLAIVKNVSDMWHSEKEPVSEIEWEMSASIPQEFDLEPNYPNPFNPKTTISYRLPEEREVSIAIYNCVGEPVRQWPVSCCPAGSHTAVWDGRDDRGQLSSSGVYIVRISAGDEHRTLKILLMK